MSGWRAVAAALALAGSATAAAAQDLTAEAMALTYDLVRPSSGSADAAGAVAALTRHGALPAERPRTRTQSQSGLLALYGRATLMGANATAFAIEIAAVRDAQVAGDWARRDDAVRALYAKAGRAPPDAATLKTIDRELRRAAGQEGRPALRYRASRNGETIEIVRAPGAGRASVEVTAPGPDGKPVRTAYLGEERTVPTADGKELAVAVSPTAVCTVGAERAAAARARLNGAWRAADGNEWTISGEGEAIELVERRRDDYELRYTGTVTLGKATAFHRIDRPADVDRLPAEVVRQLIGTGVGFTVRLDVCAASGREIKGTWASQHVTYSSLDQKISRIHDPYEVALDLARSGQTLSARGGRLPQEGP